MPIAYRRDDQRRLITAVVTDPYSLDDILGAIGQQSAEQTWDYAFLYDLRSATDLAAEAELEQIADRVKVIGAGRERGPVGIMIRARPALFLQALMYATLTKGLEAVEVLLTEAQVDAWLSRNAPPR